MTKEELGKMIDQQKFADVRRCYGDDKLRNVIKEIYIEGMMEGYELARYRLETSARMPSEAGNKFLDKNLDEIRKILKLCEQYENTCD